MDVLARVSAIIAGLALLGGSFLVWNRSRGAAFLGALAGASIVFFEIVYFVLGKLARDMGPDATRMMFATASTLQALGTYVPLGIMVFLLSRAKR